MTLLPENESGGVVGFPSLWPMEEPEAFGQSLNIECIDYFREHFLAGLETVLLSEAEKVTRAPDLDAIVLWREQLDDIRKLWAPPYVPG